MSRHMPRPVVLQLPTPCVVALMGASGAGKSTYARQLALLTNTFAISYDKCREELTGDPHDQSATAAAVELAHSRVRERCRAGLSTIVDATHTTRADRRPLVDLAAAHHLPAVLVALATSLQVCLQRQLARAPRQPGTAWGRRVPEDVVRTQHAAVLASLPHLHTEGWHSVHVLNTHHLARPAEGTA
jgi:predicted kinase